MLKEAGGLAVKVYNTSCIPGSFATLTFLLFHNKLHVINKLNYLITLQSGWQLNMEKKQTNTFVVEVWFRGAPLGQAASEMVDSTAFFADRCQNQL